MNVRKGRRQAVKYTKKYRAYVVCGRTVCYLDEFMCTEHDSNYDGVMHFTNTSGCGFVWLPDETGSLGNYARVDLLY
jgi:hypothetical protein